MTTIPRPADPKAVARITSEAETDLWQLGLSDAQIGWAFFLIGSHALARAGAVELMREYITGLENRTG